jgi:hypothetical protein
LIQEAKPKEKTVFNVTLEKFDAAAKPKIIKEIKLLIPNMNLMEVRPDLYISSLDVSHLFPDIGEEVRGVSPEGSEGEHPKRGCRPAPKDA